MPYNAYLSVELSSFQQLASIIHSAKPPAMATVATTSGQEDSAGIVAPCSAWGSLVRRSLEAWEVLAPNRVRRLEEEFLQSYTSLDGFLSQSPETLMFWFFQRRGAFLSQETMQKWSRDRLDDYVLLPATPGFVNRIDCFFISHFWHTKDDPDPTGEYLRLLQDGLRPQTWSYIWLDWTCVPQHPRSRNEETYFLKTLQTMSGIIRNSGFMWFYPPFEPRLWILYEVAEFTLTCAGELQATEDIRGFSDHVKEMLQVGVRSTLDKHGYRCTYDRDMAFLTSWLEILVLLRNLNINIDDVRRLLDNLTWHPTVGTIWFRTTKGDVELCRYEGTFRFLQSGEFHMFTPFPEWVSSLSSIMRNLLLSDSDLERW